MAGPVCGVLLYVVQGHKPSAQTVDLKADKSPDSPRQGRLRSPSRRHPFRQFLPIQGPARRSGLFCTIHYNPALHENHPLPTPEPASPFAAATGLAAGVATGVFCSHCGTNLHGLSIGQSCPGCGTHINRGQLANGGRPTSGKATASLVLGICSIVGCFFYGLPGLICGILAIVFAGQVRREVEAGQLSPAVLGHANSGRVCGWIGVGLGALALLLMVAYFIVIAVLLVQQPTQFNPSPTPSPTPVPFPGQPTNPPSVNPTQPQFPLHEDGVRKFMVFHHGMICGSVS